MAMLSSSLDMFRTMGRASRAGLVAGICVILLGTLLALWLVFSPRDEVLFANLAETDAAEITAALTEWKIPYSLSAGGSSILVDSEKMLDTRMRLVSAGIPKGGHVGYELFDDNEFGVTEFAQRINYQRALQGELERTIASIPGVRNVRVHLSIRRAGAFLGEDAASKASVALTLEPGTVLGRKHVAGIRNLVASAVEGLRPDAVVVVGPAGLQLAGNASQDADVAGDGADAASDMSARIEARINQLLQDALPGQRASVSVDVRMNFDKVRRTSEKLVGAAGSDHGMIVRRSSNGGRPVEPGAPALINEQVEYAHGTEREEITRAVGVIERISVAVVLPPGVQPAEQDRLRRLASAAAGLDAVRGDTIEISSASVAPAIQAPALQGEQAGVAPDSASPRVDVVGDGNRWVLYALIAGAFLIGIVLGGLVMRRRGGSAQLLSRAESERAALQVNAWLTDGAR